MGAPEEFLDRHGNRIPLPPDVWEGLHPLAKAHILAQQEQIAALQAHVAALKAHIAALETETSTLKEKVATLERLRRGGPPPPPGSGEPKGKPKRPKSTNRRRGAQKGHKGHHRSLFPVEKVTQVVDHFPAECRCGNVLEAVPDANPIIHQVVEVPRIQVDVVEHRRHRVCCPRCSEVTTAQLPADVPWGALGPRAVALVALLTGRFRMSRRDVEDYFRSVLGAPISLGCVKGSEEVVSQALAEPMEEAASAVQSAPVGNIDETGWRQENGKAVLWIFNTPHMAVYRITPTRDGETLRGILGGFQGVLGTDRHSIYSSYPMERHQVCLAHVDRDFEKMVARGGESKRVGLQGQAELDRAFELWHLHKGGTISRRALRRRMAAVQARMARVLDRGTACDHLKTQRTCANLRAALKAMFTFVRVEGVEPTNNSSERGLRPGVRWRRTSFGTQSKAGSRFVERMLTVTETCRRQGRNLLDFLAGAVNAFIAGKPAPTLLPSQSN